MAALTDALLISCATTLFLWGFRAGRFLTLCRSAAYTPSMAHMSAVLAVPAICLSIALAAQKPQPRASELRNRDVTSASSTAISP